MSDQSSTTTNPPKEQQLCKMGCGFFGSNATGDCCSKCYRELVLSKNKNEQCTPAPMDVEPSVPTNTISEEKPSATEIQAEETTKIPTPTQTTPTTKATKKKKKKKTSYKDMMKGMTQGKKTDDDIKKEKDNLMKGMGGGNFTKIDKI